MTEAGTVAADAVHGTVLVVDDEADIRELYAFWLGERYTVRTAVDGADALEQYDETVDVVFLDRRMPTMTGDEALEALRERPGDCRVAMVTAVDPDFDIISMGFDTYLVKPVTQADLFDAVERLRSRTAYSTRLDECFVLAEKRAALEAEKTPEELAASEEYAALVARLDELESTTDMDSEMDDEAFGAALRDL